MKNKSGFTIVELLVAIVVIGILSSIAVVAYRGVQDQAVNTKMLSSFDTIEKGLRLYVQEHGEYPNPTDITTPNNTFICIQPSSSGWPARDGLTSSQCGIMPGSDVEYSAVVQQELSTVLRKIPDTSDITAILEDVTSRGIYLYYMGGPNAAAGYPQGRIALLYFVRGDQPCGRGNKIANPAGDATVTSCGLILD